MFGNNLQLPSNRLLSYASALSVYRSIKPIRGRSTDTRPLARRSNDNLTIRQEECSGDIIVRLYETDIIRYREREGDGNNNLIELKPYASSTTNRVVWSILGPHVGTLWSDRSHPAPDHITEVSGRYYNTPNHILVQPKETGWELVGGAVPFEVPSLNRKEAKQALREYGYDEFRVWFKTLIRMGQDPRASHYRGRPYSWSTREVRELLSPGPKMWGEVAQRMSQYVTPDTELRALRETIYKAELCYETETVDYFDKYQSLHNALNRMRRAD
jgi:hypothetical protein